MWVPVAVSAGGLPSAGPGAVAHWLSSFDACGIFLGQELDPCALRWQVGSYPLDHRGSLIIQF